MRPTNSAAALLAATLAVLPADAARAQDVFELPEIVVSGGLTAILATSFGRAFSVLTEAQIARLGTAHVADLLRALPGVSVSQSGGAGGPTQVRLRGAEGNHTVVLIDGVRVAAPETGEYDFGGLLAADIARIEVLRGPQSALFGANAIGGVILITTRAAAAGGGGGAVRAEVGADGTLAGEIALGHRAERLALGLSVARRSVGGFDISGDPGGRADGDENLTLNLGARYELAPGVSLGATLRMTDRTSDYDAFNFGAATPEGLVTDAPYARERREVFGSVFLLAEHWGGRAETELRLSFGRMDDRNTFAGAAITDTTGRRQAARLRSTFALDAGTLAEAGHTLTLALEAEKEGFGANDPALVWDPSQLDEQTRTNLAAVAEYRGELMPGLDLQIGLRHDANDRFADATTWSAGLSWRLPNGTTRLHLSAGTGVQNPTLYEQFGFIPGQFRGNPNLRPERSFGWDIGIEQAVLGGRGTIDVTWFQDRLTDEILTLFPPPDFIGTPVNDDGTSRRRGVEVAAGLALTEALRLGLSYTYTDARDPDGRREVRRPMHQARLALDWALPGGRTDLGLVVEHAAGRRDIDFTAPSFGARRIDMPAYTLVGLSAAHRLSDRVELTARVSNLFDVRYEEVQGYAAEGLNAFLGVRTTW